MTCVDVEGRSFEAEDKFKSKGKNLSLSLSLFPVCIFHWCRFVCNAKEIIFTEIIVVSPTLGVVTLVYARHVWNPKINVHGKEMLCL